MPLSYISWYCGKANFKYSYGKKENTGQADSIRQANNIERLTFRLAAHIVQEDRKIKGDRKT